MNVMTDGTKDELLGQDFDYFLGRIRYSFGRAFSHGSGMFLLTMLFTVALFVSLRIAFPVWLQYYKDQRESIEFLFRSQLQSPFGTPVRPIIGAVTDATKAGSTSFKQTGKRQGDPNAPEDLLDCGKDFSECQGLSAGGLAVKQFSKFIREVVHACNGKRESTDISKLLYLTALASSKTEAAFNQNAFGDKDSCSENVANILPQYRETGLLEPPYLRLVLLMAGIHMMKPEIWRPWVSISALGACPPIGVKRTAREDLLPNALCDADSPLNLETEIPRQMSPDGNPLMGPVVPGQLSAWFDVPNYLLAELSSSHVLDYVVSRVLKESPASSVRASTLAPTFHPELVQAYFISPHSVLRIWTSGGLNQVETLPRTRLWTQAPYFSQLLNSLDDHSSSQVYLDTGGNGLVQTHCYPLDTINSAGVYEKETNRLEAQGKDAEPFPHAFDGAVCFDLALRSTKETLHELLNRVCKLTYIKASIWRVIFDQYGRASDVGEPDLCSSKGSLSWKKIDLKDKINSYQTLNDVKREVTEHSIGGEMVFLVPLRRQSVSEGIFLAVTPYPPSLPRLFLWSTSAALLSFVALLVVFFMLAGSRRNIELGQYLGRLRGLPVAVIEVNQDNEIVSGNDRAEELIGRELGKFGVSSRNAKRASIKDIFSEFVEAFETKKIDGRDHKKVSIDITRPRVSAEPISQEQLQPLRRLGTRSVYFARLTHNRVWLKVIATPELGLAEEAISPPWPLTFGVLLETTAREKELLESKKMTRNNY
jgi:hypothetical protein